jgi:hypothetical protein
MAALPAQDLGRAKAFYVEKVGLQALESDFLKARDGGWAWRWEMVSASCSSIPPGSDAWRSWQVVMAVSRSTGTCRWMLHRNLRTSLRPGARPWRRNVLQVVSLEPHRGNPELEDMRNAVFTVLKICDEAHILRGLDRGEQ